MDNQYEKLKKILREMFQMDQADLDFGIYRIMNQKRDEIEQFLDKDLLPQVKEEFGKYKDVQAEEKKNELKELEKKHIFYNLGILIFGFSLIVGAIAKQWWIYYAISLLSITLLGYGVILDIREIRSRMEKVISFLKEDLIQNIILSSTSENEINNMLRLIGKKNRLDTFLVVKISSEEPDTSKRIDAHRRVTEISLKVLDQLLDQANYLLMPLGSSRIGICVSALQKLQEKPGFLIDLAEQIRQEVSLKTSATVTIGIGSSYKYPHDYPEGFVEQDYLGEKKNYYHPKDIGREKNLKDYLQKLRILVQGDNAKQNPTEG